MSETDIYWLPLVLVLLYLGLVFAILWLIPETKLDKRYSCCWACGMVFHNYYPDEETDDNDRV